MHTHTHDNPDAPGAGTGTAAGATIVASLGLILVAMVLSGQLTNYLQPYFRPWVLLTGALLLLLAGWTFLRLWKDSRERGDGSLVAAENPMRKTSWLLLVPVLLATLCAPSPLGAAMLNSSAVGGSSVSNAANEQAATRVASRVGRNDDGTIAYDVLSDSAPTDITLEDLANRFTFGRKGELQDKPVKIVGFAAAAADGQWRVNRFKIYCCAADAVPYTAQLNGTPTAPEADTWYEVTGTVDALSSETVPILTVSEFTPIKQPEIPYL